MSTEPMSEEQRAAIAMRARCASKGPWKLDEMADRIYGPRAKDGEFIAEIRGFGFLTSVCNLSPEGAEVVQRANGEFIVHAREDVPALLAEIERLKDKYEGKAPRCNAGHENTLPLALWDCPTCTEALRRVAVSRKVLLDEAREQNEAFQRRAEAAERDMEAAEAYAVELRAALEYMGEKHCSNVCGNTRYGTHSPECRTAYSALNLTPAAARQLQKARRDVVEAAKAWRTGEQPVAHAFALQAVVDALEKLEAAS